MIPFILIAAFGAFFLLSTKKNGLLYPESFKNIDLPWNADESVEEYVLKVLNLIREREGIEPLKLKATSKFCMAQQGRDFFMSNIPHRLFGQCGEKGQNQCLFKYRQRGLVTECLKHMYGEGPGENFHEHGHYLNIVNPDFKEVSIYQSGVVLTMNFY